jgi:hypothetical protein
MRITTLNVVLDVTLGLAGLDDAESKGDSGATFSRADILSDMAVIHFLLFCSICFAATPASSYFVGLVRLTFHSVPPLIPVTDWRIFGEDCRFVVANSMFCQL